MERDAVGDAVCCLSQVQVPGLMPSGCLDVVPFPVGVGFSFGPESGHAFGNNLPTQGPDDAKFLVSHSHLQLHVQASRCLRTEPFPLREKIDFQLQAVRLVLWTSTHAGILTYVDLRGCGMGLGLGCTFVEPSVFMSWLLKRPNLGVGRAISKCHLEPTRKHRIQQPPWSTL